MKSVSFGDELAVPVFNVPEDDSYYWLLRLCYQEVLQNQELRAQGININEIDGNELYAAEGRFDSFVSYLSTWLSNAVLAAENEQPITPFDYNAIPDLVELLLLCVTGNWGLIFALFVKVGLKFVLDWLQQKLPVDNNLDEAAQVLDKIFLDKTDPSEVKNRIEQLCYLLQSATASVNINFGNEECDNIGICCDSSE